ncbi:hypothetical protein [Solibacillus isronensis]|uniref:hypothetical protein n=1 Tax=Solibacillus isronensis TaxID=412383 RepID=UPI0039A103D6
MLKKLSMFLTTLLLVILFTIPAFAEEIVEVEGSSQTQTSDSIVTQNQNVNSEGTAEKIDQEQGSATDKSQEQNANQHGTLQQEQATSINASQNQVVNNADVLDADQNQGVNVNASQSQTTSNQTQDQSESIVTSQDQSIDSNETKKAVQDQSVIIENKQEQVLNQYVDLEKSETDILAKQTQELVSRGDAEINQNQSVTLSAEELAVKTATNIIIKSLVKVFQTIEIDGEDNITFTDEFELGDSPYSNNLSKVFHYGWGTISVVNNILVKKGENDFIHTWAESIIDIQHHTQSEYYDSIDEYEWIDSDGDGLSDDEEIRWGTNPFNPDTDGDGLTDYFEVIHFKKDVLDPRIKDTDKNGINDGEEDFDNDGFTNLEEQKKRTNPHVSN